MSKKKEKNDALMEYEEKTVYKRKALPLYLTAATALILTKYLPLYELWGLILYVGITAGAWLFFEKKIKKKPVVIKVPALPKTTGDSTADAVIREGREYISKMRAANDAIAEPEISAKIDRVADICDKIFAHISENPQKIPQIRRFMNYYLPTITKLLESYDVLEKQEINGGNISRSMSEINHIMDIVEPAFKKQLDNLFSTEALDISADVTVLESLLNQ